MWIWPVPVESSAVFESTPETLSHPTSHWEQSPLTHTSGLKCDLEQSSITPHKTSLLMPLKITSLGKVVTARRGDSGRSQHCTLQTTRMSCDSFLRLSPTEQILDAEKQIWGIFLSCSMTRYRKCQHNIENENDQY